MVEQPLLFLLVSLLVGLWPFLVPDLRAVSGFLVVPNFGGLTPVTKTLKEFVAGPPGGVNRILRVRKVFFFLTFWHTLWCSTRETGCLHRVASSGVDSRSTRDWRTIFQVPPFRCECLAVVMFDGLFPVCSRPRHLWWWRRRNVYFRTLSRSPMSCASWSTR